MCAEGGRGLAVNLLDENNISLYGSNEPIGKDGTHISQDRARREVCRTRFETLFSPVFDNDLTQPARAFNRVFQPSSQPVYSLQHPGGK